MTFLMIYLKSCDTYCDEYKLWFNVWIEMLPLFSDLLKWEVRKGKVKERR